MSKQIANFTKDNLSFFQEFNTIKIYYDNGQVELTKILVSVFNGLFIDVKFIKVIPSNYKLFQAADLFCYFTLAQLKYEKKTLSLIETRFFESYRQLQKNYLKQVAKYNFK